jgi:ABC-2 type transport system permease protein
MTTTTAPTVTPTTARPAVRTGGAGFVTATGQTARRTILQYARTPQLLVLPTIMGALFLFIFRYVFGGAINTSTVDYVDFLVPGFLVTVVLWTGMNAPAGDAEDAATGVHDRLRSLPIPRAAVMTGRSIADSGLIAWTLFVTALLGYAVGFNTHADVGSVALAYALMLVADYAFVWMFISLGLTAGNAQAAQGVSSILVVPLTFLSGAYVPVHSMPGWMQPFAANQPVTVIINAVRSLMLGGNHAAGVGHTTAYWVLLSLAWCAGILAMFAAIAVKRFGRMR